MGSRKTNLRVVQSSNRRHTVIFRLSHFLHLRSRLGVLPIRTAAFRRYRGSHICTNQNPPWVKWSFDFGLFLKKPFCLAMRVQEAPGLEIVHMVISRTLGSAPYSRICLFGMLDLGLVVLRNARVKHKDDIKLKDMESCTFLVLG